MPNSGLILRLASFLVTNGPDLHVLLAESSRPARGVELGNYLDLGSFKGNIWDQN